MIVNLFLFSPKEIVLNVKVRIPDSKCYAPAKEFVWNTASGSSPRNLKQAIADALLLPAQHIVLAKHFQQRFEWVILLDANYVRAYIFLFYMAALAELLCSYPSVFLATKAINNFLLSSKQYCIYSRLSRTRT